MDTLSALDLCERVWRFAHKSRFYCVQLDVELCGTPSGKFPFDHPPPCGAPATPNFCPSDSRADTAYRNATRYRRTGGIQLPSLDYNTGFRQFNIGPGHLAFGVTATGSAALQLIPFRHSKRRYRMFEALIGAERRVRNICGCEMVHGHGSDGMPCNGR